MDNTIFGTIIHYMFVILLLTSNKQFSRSQLVVNVKTVHGQLTQQQIIANPDKDIVMIDFTYAGGTQIKALIDFPKKLQVLKATILGEMERGEKPLHVVCFVVKFSTSEFISSDAMSKLRQKNPGAIRIPEEELKSEHIMMEKEIPLRSAALFSGHVHHVCGDADKIYTSEDIIKTIGEGDKQHTQELLSSVDNIKSNDSSMANCADTIDKLNKCICHYELCLSWYPCALKYCENHGQDGEKVSYRCGIKTCGKCRNFQYFVDHKEDCFWNTNFIDKL